MTPKWCDLVPGLRPFEPHGSKPALQQLANCGRRAGHPSLEFEIIDSPQFVSVEYSNRVRTLILINRLIAPMVPSPISVAAVFAQMPDLCIILC